VNKQSLRVADESPAFGGNAVFDAFRYSPAVKAGGLLFISGQVGLRRDGTIPDDVRDQADLAFQRTAEILELCGLGFEDVVELVSYHVDVGENLSAFRETKDRYIVAPYPAWTIVGVAALARPALKVELKCIAAL